MPAGVERIKEALMRDPKFKPQKGRTKEQSAWAVAWSAYRKRRGNANVEKAVPYSGFELYKAYMEKYRRWRRHIRHDETRPPRFLPLNGRRRGWRK